MTTYRYSTLSDAHKCLRYYELKHILGLDDGGDKSGDMAFGTCMHAAQQDLFEIGNGVDVFRAQWAEQKDKGLVYTRYSHEELAKLGPALIEIFRDEHLKHFQPVYLEKQLTTRLTPTIGYSGTLDFLGQYKGVPSVVDWKTAGYPYDAYKIVVNEQMYGYAHLAKQELAYKAEQVVYGVAVKDLANPRWQFKKAPLTEQILTKKLANILAMCNTLACTKVFYQNPSQCVVGKKICPFYSQCHAGGSLSQDGKDKETA